MVAKYGGLRMLLLFTKNTSINQPAVGGVAEKEQ